MGNKNDVTFIVQFSCLHVREFREPVPVIGDHLWCPACRETVTVKSAPAEYRIRCKMCTHMRRFGTSKINAEIAAAKHRISKPGHVVKMFNGHDLVRTFGESDQTVTLPIPGCDEEIPF